MNKAQALQTLIGREIENRSKENEMNQESEIPENIAVIIEAAIEQQAQEKAEEQKREEAEYAERVERGQKHLLAWIADEIKDAPDWLKPYFVRINQDDHEERHFAALYGKQGETSTPDKDLVFQVPGLAPIVWIVKESQFGCFRAMRDEEIQEALWGDWRNTYVRAESVPALLVRAKQEFEMFQDYAAAFEKEKEREIQYAREHEAHVMEKELMDQAIAETLADEEAEVFNAIKNDPVAVALVKAFMLVQEERQQFLSQVDGAV